LQLGIEGEGQRFGVQGVGKFASIRGGEILNRLSYRDDPA